MYRVQTCDKTGDQICDQICDRIFVSAGGTGFFAGDIKYKKAGTASFYMLQFPPFYILCFHLFYAFLCLRLMNAKQVSVPLGTLKKPDFPSPRLLCLNVSRGSQCFGAKYGSACRTADSVV